MRPRMLAVLAALLTGVTIASAQPVNLGAGTGTAIIRDHAGRAHRLACTMAVNPPYATWTCSGRAGPVTAQAVERSIRAFYAELGFIRSVSIHAQRNGRITGTLRVALDGEETRQRCDAERTGADGAVFRWRCTEL